MTTRSRFIAGLVAGTAGAAAGPLRAADVAAAPLHVALVAVADSAPFEYALQQNWFAQAGLDVKADLLASGSAVAAALIGGAVDIPSSNLFTAVQARAKGVPFLVVAPGGRFDPANPTSQLLVAVDSPIKTGKDLEGRTVAVAA